MAQQHAGSCSDEIATLLNGYLPVPDVRDYIVTPAVAGNGSLAGNFVLAKQVKAKKGKIKTVVNRVDDNWARD